MLQRKRDRTPKQGFIRRALAYLWRALRLRCPYCGRCPMFVPILRLKSLYDWFTPLDGCHACGHPYVRDDGYWLVPVWIIGFGVSTACGATAATLARYLLHWELLPITFLACGTTLVTSFLGARHAKSLFLALDQYFDPPLEEGREARG